MQHITSSEDQTISLAKSIAPRLAPGDVLLLEGDLGMGKSVFARALIRALCGDEQLEVPSPTFTLVQTYEANIAPLWHFDLYRLKDAEEIYELGWEEALDGGIVIVEWPERLDILAPQGARHITFSKVEGGDSQRQIEIKP